jgi:hypothetical protein
MKYRLLFLLFFAPIIVAAQSEEELVAAAVGKATIVRYALVEVNGLGEYELRSAIGVLKEEDAAAIAKIVADPKSVSRLHLKCIPKFNVKIIFGNPRTSDVVEMLLCTGCRQTISWLNRKHSREFDFTSEAQKKLLDALAPALPAIRSIPDEKED